jgi:hypothetical protein
MEDDDQFNMEESDNEECMPQNVPEMEDTALKVADMSEEDLLNEGLVFWPSDEEIEDDDIPILPEFPQPYGGKACQETFMDINQGIMYFMESQVQ